MEIVFRSQKKSRMTRKHSRKIIGRSSVLEMKRSGTELSATHLKENEVPSPQRGGTFPRNWTPSIIQGHQCFESWHSEKEKCQRHHTLQCGCFKHSSFFRIAHSVNQLSINGAVSSWCEQFGLTEEEKEQERPFGREESVTHGILSSVNSQEVKLLVPSPRLASGNSLRKTFRALNDCPRQFDSQGFAKTQFSCIGYKTRPDEDDGFGQLIPFCRENTFSLVTTNSELLQQFLEEQLLDQSLKFRS